MLEEIVEIRKGKDTKRIFLEGDRLIEEALASGLALETWITLAADSVPVGATPPTPPAAKQILEVTSSVMNLLSDVATPPGKIAIVLKPQRSWDAFFNHENPFLIILDALQDPGNAAAIIRTAEAAGVHGVITTPGTARLFTPKALRGAMGSSFRVPILEHQPVQTILAHLNAQGCKLYGADAESKEKQAVRYTDMDWKSSCALILGQEGGGLSTTWGDHLAGLVSIPMHKPVESLNVGAAATLLLYEMARQRGWPA